MMAQEARSTEERVKLPWRATAATLVAGLVLICYGAISGHRWAIGLAVAAFAWLPVFGLIAAARLSMQRPARGGPRRDNIVDGAMRVLDLGGDTKGPSVENSHNHEATDRSGRRARLQDAPGHVRNDSDQQR